MFTFAKNQSTMLDKKDVIAIGCDHAGFEMKEFLMTKLSESGFSLFDFGTHSTDSVDYPDMIHPLAKAVNDGQYKHGIILCGSGVGVCIVANKYPKVRAALVWQADIAKLSRQHNDANIICLPARFITDEQALTFVKLFLNTDFEGGRHQRRVDKIPPPASQI
jgi:ribose 5-phosphate isomerase B